MIRLPGVAPSRVRELKQEVCNTLLDKGMSHPHGCVNWNFLEKDDLSVYLVAPSRVRELKQHTPFWICCQVLSHPHGCVNWNNWRIERHFNSHVAPSRVRELKLSKAKQINLHSCRTLTGAWIETFRNNCFFNCCYVAPSRVRELKPLHWTTQSKTEVAPSRVRELKRTSCPIAMIVQRRTLTGAWIETLK